ncbi:MAG: hypothetical protein JKX76_02220 [Colwellia sp.]|nr:hypothetical protein [Colwellia sp.]
MEITIISNVQDVSPYTGPDTSGTWLTYKSIDWDTPQTYQDVSTLVNILLSGDYRIFDKENSFSYIQDIVTQKICVLLDNQDLVEYLLPKIQLNRTIISTSKKILLIVGMLCKLFGYEYIRLDDQTTKTIYYNESIPGASFIEERNLRRDWGVHNLAASESYLNIDLSNSPKWSATTNHGHIIHQCVIPWTQNIGIKIL